MKLLQYWIQIHENWLFKSMGMQAFHTCIYEFLTGYGHDITEPYIIFHNLGTKYTQQSASTTPTVDVYVTSECILLCSPTLSCWGRTCWSGGCDLLIIFGSQDVKYDICLFNIISIFSLSLNIINTCMKSSHTHAFVSLVFMDFGFNLEVVSYHICMRDVIWFWWFCDSHIWCVTL